MYDKSKVYDESSKAIDDKSKVLDELSKVLDDIKNLQIVNKFYSILLQYKLTGCYICQKLTFIYLINTNLKNLLMNDL
jgi:hypothetical protein